MSKDPSMWALVTRSAISLDDGRHTLSPRSSVPSPIIVVVLFVFPFSSSLSLSLILVLTVVVIVVIVVIVIVIVIKVLLSLCVIHEQKKGLYSRWAPWLASFPSLEKTEQPIGWSEDDAAFLQNSPVIRQSFLLPPSPSFLLPLFFLLLFSSLE